MENNNEQIQEQFLKLLTANEAGIRAYVRRFVPTREDAADIMQRISLVLWKKFGELSSLDDFRPWSFGVARYETLAWIRDKARDRIVLADDVLQAVARDSVESENRLSAQRDALEDCLASLPAPQRDLVLAAYSPDVGMQGAAKQSGRTLAAFYQWLHRTRMRLMECTRRALKAEGLA